MSARLRAIARDTMDLLAAGRYSTSDGRTVLLGESTTAAVSGTRLYLPEPTPEGTGPLPVVEVTGETTLQAARRLANPAALVFASAKNPGGGFLTGAQAQEESIARASALYPCLTSVPEFYEYHREQRDLLYSDRVIYSPRVPVFRDDRGELLDEAYEVSFLTSAAPNKGALLSNQPHDADKVAPTLVARARRVIAVARACGERNLVLGAWGCGVFRNDSTVVADAFAGALAGTKECFDKVVFAVPDQANRAAFEDRFVS